MRNISLKFAKFNGMKCPPRQSDHLLVKLKLMFNFFSSYLLWEGKFVKLKEMPPTAVRLFAYKIGIDA